MFEETLPLAGRLVVVRRDGAFRGVDGLSDLITDGRTGLQETGSGAGDLSGGFEGAG